MEGVKALGLILGALLLLVLIFPWVERYFDWVNPPTPIERILR